MLLCSVLFLLEWENPDFRRFDSSCIITTIQERNLYAIAKQHACRSDTARHCLYFIVPTETNSGQGLDKIIEMFFFFLDGNRMCIDDYENDGDTIGDYWICC